MVPMFVSSSKLENLETRSNVNCMMCSFPSYNYTCSFKIGTVVFLPNTYIRGEKPDRLGDRVSFIAMLVLCRKKRG